MRQPLRAGAVVFKSGKFGLCLHLVISTLLLYTLTGTREDSSLQHVQVSAVTCATTGGMPCQCG